MMDVVEIMDAIPHRYPFLFVDRVLELELDTVKRIVAIKNVSADEPFFQGHFPGRPIMPGVLMIEAMAQVGGILARKTSGSEDNMVYFMSIEKAKFRRPVVPGDQLRMEVELVKSRNSVYKFKGSASVDGKVVCESEFTAMTTGK